MKIVDKISVKELQAMAEKMYGDMVKADVDVAKKIMIVDLVWHAEGEAYLMEHGSKQENLWGINLHPTDYGSDDFIEFDSMINLKPRQGNSSRNVLDPKIQKQIRELVAGVVHE